MPLAEKLEKFSALDFGSSDPIVFVCTKLSSIARKFHTIPLVQDRSRGVDTSSEVHPVDSWYGQNLFYFYARMNKIF